LLDEVKTVTVDIEEPDLYAAVCKTNRGDQANVPGTYDADGIGTFLPFPCPL
jgi:hypothetical protein